MDDVWFSKPISVSVGITGTVRHVSSARQAIDLLKNHWPGAGTEKHRHAQHVCLEAINGLKKPEVAREAFVEAAREARILVE
jgi:hypothetical protein